ncbi:MAG: hypothetical protein AAFN93_13390, partial [Bacteroidota bacterium]
SIRITYFYLFLILFSNCGQKQPDTIVSTKGNDSTQTESDTANVEKIELSDPFYDAMITFSSDFTKYKANSTQLVDTLTEVTDHWLFEVVEKNRELLQRTENAASSKKLNKLPTPKDYDLIYQIRQSTFFSSYEGNHDVVFEEWAFDNTEDAEQWLSFMRDSLRGNIYTKPPRYEWTEGAKMYLVSTRSAQQWFGFSDTLIARLSGKTRSQLQYLYNPMNLPHFKKWNGPANSSAINAPPHLYKRGDGPFYSYFYFVKQRLTGQERANSGSEFPTKEAFHITTSLHEPLTGNEQFDSIEETLVEIQCSINDSDLNSLDIVGKSIDEIKELFGDELFEKDGMKVFGHANRILVIKMNDNQVEAFKYLRLIEPFDMLKDDLEMMNNHILKFG